MNASITINKMNKGSIALERFLVCIYYFFEEVSLIILVKITTNIINGNIHVNKGMDKFIFLSSHMPRYNVTARLMQSCVAKPAYCSNKFLLSFLSVIVKGKIKEYKN